MFLQGLKPLKSQLGLRYLNKYLRNVRKDFTNGKGFGCLEKKSRFK